LPKSGRQENGGKTVEQVKELLDHRVVGTSGPSQFAEPQNLLTLGTRHGLLRTWGGVVFAIDSMGFLCRSRQRGVGQEKNFCGVDGVKRSAPRR